MHEIAWNRMPSRTGRRGVSQKRQRFEARARGSLMANGNYETVYLGSFATADEAEVAYLDFVLPRLVGGTA